MAPGNLQLIAMTKTSLAKGNSALREGNYEEAVRHYVENLKISPAFWHNITFNLVIARQRYRVNRQRSEKQRIAVCGSGHPQNAAMRVYYLAMLYETLGEVEIIGSLFPGGSQDDCEPMRHISIPKHTFLVDDQGLFIEQAIQFVVNHPYDIVHLSKPHFPNMIMGILFKQIWDAKVLMDIDEEHYSFVNAETPLSLDDYINKFDALPLLDDLHGVKWTRLSLGLVSAFDVITSSNLALQHRYGGIILRDANGADSYQHALELKRKARQKIGISQDKKVVLIRAPSVEYKFLLESAQAIASLDRCDIVIAIIGDLIYPVQKEMLKTISGLEFVFIECRSMDEICEVGVVGDVYLILQEPETCSKLFNMTTKLGEVFAMIMPVMAAETSGLAETISNYPIIPVNLINLPEKLGKLLDDANIPLSLLEANHDIFLSNLTLAENRRHLKKTIAEKVNQPLKIQAERFAIQLGSNHLSSLVRGKKISIKSKPGTVTSPQLTDVPLGGWGTAFIPSNWSQYKTLLDKAERLFDPGYYATQIPNSYEVDLSLFQHFCLQGWREGLDPNPLFSTNEYLVLNADALDSDVNPLVHYVSSALRGYHNMGGIFDSKYYLDHHPDACDSGASPLEHFVFFGLRHGYKPSRGIDPFSFLAPKDLSAAPWKLAALLMERIKSAANTIEPISVSVKEAPDLTIIIYANDNATSVLCCITSLLEAPPKCPFEIIIADDGSHDHLPLLAARWKGVNRVPSCGHVGWAKAINRAAEFATGRFIAFLDGYCEVLSGWEEELMEALVCNSKRVVGGGKVVNVSGSIQHGGGFAWSEGKLTILGQDQDPKHPFFNYLRTVDFVSHTFLFVKSDAFYRVKGFDEAYGSPEYSAADFCLKMKRHGWQVVFQPFAQIIRYVNLNDWQNNSDKLLMENRWSEQLPPFIKDHSKSNRGVVGHALIVDQITPTPDQDSGSIDQVNLIVILLQLGWAVSFVPEVEMEHRKTYTTNLQKMGVQCIFKPYYVNLWDFIKDAGKTIDLALLYKGRPTVHYLDIIKPHCPKAKFIFDTVDIHHLRELREAELFKDENKKKYALQTKKIEIEAIRRTDCTIILSVAEEKLIRKEIPNAKLVVIPLIRDIPGPQFPREELHDICFIGGFLHQPNRDAIHYFVEYIWPLVSVRLLSVKFRIMGSNIPPDIYALQSDSVVIDGFVPDLKTSFAKCRLSVAPLRYGAGLKGKIASSLGFGIPCVATTIAAEGMGSGECFGVEIADEPYEFADKIVHLYTDHKHWSELSRTGLNYVNQEFSVQANKKRFSTILSDLELPFMDPSGLLASRIGLESENNNKRIIYNTVKQTRSPVSVLIPLYNHEKYIVSALESVFNQSYPPLEVIIIDDGSSDHSAEVARRLCDGYPGAKLFKQTNMGAHHTINTLIRRASQPIVSILNSDDTYHPKRLERCLNQMRDSCRKIITTAIEFINADGNYIENKWYEDGIAFWNSIANTSLALLNGNIFMSTSNLVMHRSLFRDIGYFRDFRYAHDLDFFIRALSKGHIFDFNTEPLLNYRYHPTNTISENHIKVRAEWAYICTSVLNDHPDCLLEGMQRWDYVNKLAEIMHKHQLSQSGLLILSTMRRDESELLAYSQIACRTDLRDTIQRSLE
jgi:glycosyltransferase involved in cell wall biosynthesis